MSSISVDVVSTFKINANELENMITFIYSHEEHYLQQYGAIKVKLDIDCELALKKRDIFVILDTNTGQLMKNNFQ
jgi:hypothetical protein